jgi:hypothetical protein
VTTDAAAKTFSPFTVKDLQPFTVLANFRRIELESFSREEIIFQEIS